MDIKRALFDLLVAFPALDSPDERKALMIATGFSHLGIYLDWQGSNVEFTTRLLEEFGRRDKGMLVTFLGELGKTTQASVERKATLATLQGQLSTLDDQEWQRHFAVAAAPAEARPAADVDVLATTLVAEVLAPYFELGAEKLAERAGSEAARLAGQVATRIEAAFAGDPSAAVVFDLFKQSPKVAHATFAALLKPRLVAEPQLAAELAQAIAGREKASAQGMEGLLKVAQDVQTVRGEVIGVLYGPDFQGKVAGVIDVKQTIDTVEEEGKVVGASFGSWPPR
jgi:hypothetical protein